MKVRLGFVSNSSASSFIIHRMHLSKAQVNLIRQHAEFSDFMHKLDPEWQECDGEEWHLAESSGRLEGFTGQDNFAMYEFFERIGVDPTLAHWTHSDSDFEEQEDAELADYEAGQIELEHESTVAGPEDQNPDDNALAAMVLAALGGQSPVPAIERSMESYRYGRTRVPAYLTADALAKVPDYLEKWSRIGSSCERIGIDKAKAAATAVFLDAGWPPPRIMVADGPRSALDTIAALRSWPLDRGAMVLPLKLQAGLLEQAYSQIFTRFGLDQLSGLIDDMPPLIWRKLEMLSRLPRECVFEVLRRLDERRPNRPSIPQAGSLGDQVPVLFHRLPYLFLCDFLTSAGNYLCPDSLAGEIRLAQICGGWIPVLVGRPQPGHTETAQAVGRSFQPGDTVVVIQRRPCELHTNDNGLHRHGGPAVRYPDGFSVWALNGVWVPQWLAESRSEDIDPRKLLAAENDEVRRELVRKVGLDRVCYSLNAQCIDKAGNYELLLLDLGDYRRRPYLKMLNPSIGTWHVEGVHPRCRTVAEALAWRNDTPDSPVELT